MNSKPTRDCVQRRCVEHVNLVTITVTRSTDPHRFGVIVGGVRVVEIFAVPSDPGGVWVVGYTDAGIVEGRVIAIEDGPHDVSLSEWLAHSDA